MSTLKSKGEFICDNLLVGVAGVIVSTLLIILGGVIVRNTAVGFNVGCFLKGGNITHVLGADWCVKNGEIIGARTDW